MFTGRAFGELFHGYRSSRGSTPGVPTLASYLGCCGYATVGFVANATFYCNAAGSGLASGFDHYEDF